MTTNTTTSAKPAQDPELLLQETDWAFCAFLAACVIIAIVITWLQNRRFRPICSWCGNSKRICFTIVNCYGEHRCLCHTCRENLQHALNIQQR